VRRRKLKIVLLLYVLLSFFGVWMRDALKVKFGLKSDKKRTPKANVKKQNWSSNFAIGDLDFQSLLLLLCLHLRWNSSCATYGRDFSWLVVLKLNHILANSVRYFVCLFVFWVFFFVFWLKNICESTIYEQ